MTFLALDKETDELIEVLEDLSPEDIENYEEIHPDRYVQDETYFEDDGFYEDAIDYSDLW
jgi:hypothetical protein